MHLGLRQDRDLCRISFQHIWRGGRLLDPGHHSHRADSQIQVGLPSFLYGVAARTGGEPRPKGERVAECNSLLGNVPLFITAPSTASHTVGSYGK